MVDATTPSHEGEEPALERALLLVGAGERAGEGPLSKAPSQRHDRGAFSPETLVDVLTSELDSSRRELVLLRSSMAEKEAEYHQVLRALVKEQAARDEEAARRAAEQEARVRELEARRLPSESRYREMERQCAESERAMLRMQEMLQQLARHKHSRNGDADGAGRSPLDIEKQAHRADLLDLAIERSAHAEATAALEEQLEIERRAYAEDTSALVRLASLDVRQLPPRVRAVLRMEWAAGGGVEGAGWDEDESEDDGSDSQTIVSGSSGGGKYSLESEDQGRVAPSMSVEVGDDLDNTTVTSESETYSLDNSNEAGDPEPRAPPANRATSPPDTFGRLQSTDDNIRASLQASQQQQQQQQKEEEEPKGPPAEAGAEAVEGDVCFIQSTLNAAIERYYAHARRRKRGATTPGSTGSPTPLKDIVGNLVSSLQAVVDDDNEPAEVPPTSGRAETPRTAGWPAEARPAPASPAPAGAAGPPVAMVPEIVRAVIQTLEATSRLPPASAPPSAMAPPRPDRQVEPGMPALDEIVSRVIDTILHSEGSARRLRERIRAETAAGARGDPGRAGGDGAGGPADDRAWQMHDAVLSSLASRLSLASNTGTMEADGLQWTYAEQEGLETELPPPIPVQEEETLAEDEWGDADEAGPDAAAAAVPPPLPEEEASGVLAQGIEDGAPSCAPVDAMGVADASRGDTDIVKERLRVSSILLRQADSININVDDIDSSDSEVDDDDDGERDGLGTADPARDASRAASSEATDAPASPAPAPEPTSGTAAPPGLGSQQQQQQQRRKLSLTPPPIPERIRRSLGERLRSQSSEGPPAPAEDAEDGDADPARTEPEAGHPAIQEEDSAEPMSRARKSTLRLGTALPGIGTVARPSQTKQIPELHAAEILVEPERAPEAARPAPVEAPGTSTTASPPGDAEGASDDNDGSAPPSPAPGPLFEPLAEQLTKSRDRIASRANSISPVSDLPVFGAEGDGAMRAGGLTSIREDEPGASRPRSASKLAVTAPPPRRKLGAASKGMMKKLGK